MLLAMMQLGARGYTRDEIKSALHSPEDSTMKNEYRNLIDSLRVRSLIILKSKSALAPFAAKAY